MSYHHVFYRCGHMGRVLSENYPYTRILGKCPRCCDAEVRYSSAPILKRPVLPEFASQPGELWYDLGTVKEKP